MQSLQQPQAAPSGHAAAEPIRRVARDDGLPSIVVEQHPTLVLGVTDDALVLDRGSIACRAESAAQWQDPAPLYA